MGRRADRKKARRKIRRGDLVTWGNRVSSARVIEVLFDGVYVDTALEDGTPAPRYFVSWEGGRRGAGPGISPLAKVG